MDALYWMPLKLPCAPAQMYHSHLCCWVFSFILKIIIIRVKDTLHKNAYWPIWRTLWVVLTWWPCSGHEGLSAKAILLSWWLLLSSELQLKFYDFRLLNNILENTSLSYSFLRISETCQRFPVAHRIRIAGKNPCQCFSSVSPGPSRVPGPW